MKRSTSLLLFHALLSVVSGILITQMSLLGRIGIHTMYRQFMVFRSWWKTALLLFAAQCLLLGLLWGVRKMANLSVAKKTAWLLLIVGIAGFGATYWDFSTTMHKVMKAKFHFGFYLFWIGWWVSCLYFITIKNEKPNNEIVSQLDNEPVDKLTNWQITSFFLSFFFFMSYFFRNLHHGNYKKNPNETIGNSPFYGCPPQHFSTC